MQRMMSIEASEPKPTMQRMMSIEASKRKPTNMRMPDPPFVPPSLLPFAPLQDFRLVQTSSPAASSQFVANPPIQLYVNQL
jgi:hypothetical protein